MRGGEGKAPPHLLKHPNYREVFVMYPQTNAARSVRDLSGVWDFRFNANDPWQAHRRARVL